MSSPVDFDPMLILRALVTSFRLVRKFHLRTSGTT